MEAGKTEGLVHLIRDVFIPSGAKILGLTNPVPPAPSSTSKLNSLNLKLFAIIRIYKSESGEVKFESVADVPPESTPLPSFLSLEGKRTRQFLYFKRSLSFISDFMKLLESKGGTGILLHLNEIKLKYFFVILKSDRIDLKKGLYLLFPFANQYPDIKENTILGKDLILQEFINLTRLINEFKCKHHRNNFYKVIGIVMSCYEHSYQSRQDLIVAITDSLTKLKKKAVEYEEIFENPSSLCINYYFKDITCSSNHFTPEGDSDNASPQPKCKEDLPTVNISRNEKICDGRDG